MNDCRLCKHFYEERDINYQECKINEDEDYWFSDEECPRFEGEEEWKSK